MPTFDARPAIIVLRPLRNPDDPETFILVPVVEAIAMRDPKDESQVRLFRFRNGRGPLVAGAGRTTHERRVVQKIGTPLDYTEDESNAALVERIDMLPVLDTKTSAQIFARRFLNTDQDNTWPAKPELLDEIRNRAGPRMMREVVRITADNTPDGTPWADFEWIFMTGVIDPKTSSQIYGYRFQWPEFGDKVADTDDPYRPYFVAINEDMEIVDDEQNEAAFRDSPISNLVNINWDSSCQFEVDTFDPHRTAIAAARDQVAIMRQEATTIDDFKKFTLSMWFNIPNDQPTIFDDLASAFQSYRLMEFSGPPAANYPQTSKIDIRKPQDIQADGLILYIELMGPTVEFEFTVIVNFYGETFWVDILGFPFDPPSSAPHKVTVADFINLDSIKPVWKYNLATFLDNWHHLAISLDASAISFTDLEELTTYHWMWEATGTFVDINDPNTFSVIATSSGLFDRGITATPGPSPYGDTIATIDGRPNDVLASLPDPEDYPNQRIRVFYYDLANLWGEPPGTNFGDTYTAVASTVPKAAGDGTFPLHMYLDGKSHKRSSGSGEHVGEIEVSPDNSISPAADGKDGFILKGSELSLPRRKETITPNPFDTNMVDIRRRHAKLQVWFDTYVDLNVPANLAKFIETRPMPERPPGAPPAPPGTPTTGTLVGNPAKIAKADREAAVLAQLPPERLISAAALAFGQPHMYHDGGAATLNEDTGDWQGFARNKGKGGKFTVLNDIENFSPSPKDIPII